MLMKKEAGWRNSVLQRADPGWNQPVVITTSQNSSLDLRLPDVGLVTPRVP